MITFRHLYLMLRFFLIFDMIAYPFIQKMHVLTGQNHVYEDIYIKICYLLPNE